jgi:phage shock protein E
MRRSILLLVAATMLGLVACGGGGGGDVATAPGVVTVAPSEAADVIADHQDDAAFTILDVRTPEEFAAGHLDGAVNIDIYDPGFEDAIAALDPAGVYVLYCRTGNRSAAAADLMRQLSFTAVYEIQGGIVAWDAAGLPVAG